MGRKQDHSSHVTRVFLARHPVKHIKWNSWAKSNLWFSRLVSQIMEQKRLCWGATTFIASPLSLSFHILCITGHDGRSLTLFYFQAIFPYSLHHRSQVDGQSFILPYFHQSILWFHSIKQKCFLAHVVPFEKLSSFIHSRLSRVLTSLDRYMGWYRTTLV